MTIPALLALSVAGSSLDRQEFKITDVQVRHIFAGKLGDRLKTELTLEGSGRTIHVSVQDIRYSRFERKNSEFNVGDTVYIVPSESKELKLTPCQIHKSK